MVLSGSLWFFVVIGWFFVVLILLVGSCWFLVVLCGYWFVGGFWCLLMFLVVLDNSWPFLRGTW